ncbi:hypothetical protein DRO69_08665 [Candidatus Bathyarchaeota archaeon]|nr:MAG: hypothetical protein DRO69_08665 [Candidatus Bathyarchaeota archaeon]
MARIGHSCFEILNLNNGLKSPYLTHFYCSIHGWIPFDEVEVRLESTPMLLCPICHRALRTTPRQARCRRNWQNNKMYKIRKKIIDKLIKEARGKRRECR